MGDLRIYLLASQIHYHISSLFVFVEKRKSIVKKDNEFFHLLGFKGPTVAWSQVE